MLIIALTLGLIIWIAGTHSYADSLYPDIPKNNLPKIRTLPKQGQVILDVRSTVLSGDPISQIRDSNGIYNGIKIGVFDLLNHSESIWDLPSEISLRAPILCNSCTMRASWAATTRQLLLATNKGAVLIDGAGHYKKLRLRMPGISIRYRDADEFAISNDGRFLAFKVDARDREDKALDPNDPYAKFGKLYDELIYEHTRDPKPITIAKSAIHFYGNGQPYGKFVSLPAWSPNSKRIAYAYQKRGSGFLASAGIVIANISKQGVVVSSGTVAIPPVHQPDDASVDELRWSPDGTQLGFVVFEYWYEHSDQYSRYTLYTVNAHGRGLKAVRFRNKNINVNAFAWSPSGQQLALRSDYQAKKLCNSNAMFYFDTGNEPCRMSENLFTSNVDGSGLKRISKKPDFRHGQLFWIQ